MSRFTDVDARTSTGFGAPPGSGIFTNAFILSLMEVPGSVVAIDGLGVVGGGGCVDVEWIMESVGGGGAAWRKEPGGMKQSLESTYVSVTLTQLTSWL